MSEWWMARTGISTSPKKYRIAGSLGVTAAAGLGYIVGLYDFTALHRERGDLTGLSALEIARGSGWDGEPESFLTALQDAGLIDMQGTNGRVVVHDWEAVQGPYLRTRDRARERMQKHRERNVTRTLRERYGERSEDLPTNLPTNQPTKRDFAADAPQKLSRTAARYRFREIEAELERLRTRSLVGVGPSDTAAHHARVAALLSEGETVRRTAYPEKRNTESTVTS